ncbi:uncharacterized protein F5147DRAFT_777834 [Suillus discolor]|uniref:Uncharacterized protein n=1 Tax=Suillus discolor TaxID=1912936 RepID=A0A9P7JPT7_9AGAM|nr:uncharacterized protein F5147DRAFT_777834 [Suillus discolor]KAG2097970.1 hypothetical protein F5147DRAFT_777834 [Suillus discolor]
MVIPHLNQHCRGPMLSVQTSLQVFPAAQDVTHGVLLGMLGTLRPSWARFSEALAGPVRTSTPKAFARRSLRLSLVSTVLCKGLSSLLPHFSTKIRDSEAQPLDQDLNVFVEEKSTLTLHLRDIPTSDLEAPAIKWLLETSTYLEVVLAPAKIIPQAE